LWIDRKAHDPGVGSAGVRHHIRRVVAARIQASVIQVVVAATMFLLSSVWLTCVRADPPAGTDWTVQQSELCMAALADAEQRYHLPPALLLSIAKVESGRPITAMTDIRPWPWTIDADGTGLFLDSKAAAIAWMRQQEPRHRFVDVGCMQVDLHYHPHAFASLEEAFDPAASANYAARLLLGLYHGEAGGSWDVAVGLYHSHTSLLAAEYRDRVALIGADVLHGTLKGVPLYVHAMRAGTLRLQLGDGHVTLINVNRQPVRRSRHPYTNCQIVAILGAYLNGGPRSGGCATAAR
jgi:Transglycosylase SLT domain